MTAQRHKLIMILVSVLLLLGVLIATAEVKYGDITVIVTNLRNAKGDVKIAVFTSAKGFPDHKENMTTGQIVPIKQKQARCVFKHLPYGTYAISALHDENRSEQMDYTFMHLPKEGYCVSKGPIGLFGPPSFKQAEFNFAQPALTVTLNMAYYH